MNKAVDRFIERPVMNKAVTASMRVPVVASDFHRHIQGYRLRAAPNEHKKNVGNTDKKT